MKQFFIMLLLIGAGLAPAYADHTIPDERTPKAFAYLFTPDEADLDRRYHTGWDNAYNSDWEYPYWSPYDWARDDDTARRIYNNFFNTGVLERQCVDWNSETPMLQMGQTWLDMSGRDKRRVVKFVAFVTGVEARGEAMELVLHRNQICHPMGVYANGQVQLY